MTLTLEAIASRPTAAAAGRGTFGPDGGTIGRHPGSTWMLSDAKVSGQHALISYQDGVFYIEDTSRNGICLNSPSNRLAPGRQYPLESGDRVLIDPYEILVSVSRDDADQGPPDYDRRDRYARDALRPAPDRFESDDPFAVPEPIRASELEEDGQEDGQKVSRQELDPLELLNLGPEAPAPPRNPPRREDLEGGFPLDAHYQPPKVASSPVPAQRSEGVVIPADYDPLAPEKSQVFAPPPPPRPVRPAIRPQPEQAAPPPPPRPEPDPIAPPPADVERRAPVVRRVASATGPCAELGVVLAGAGLDPALATPELARQLGEILRVVVSGVMDVMESRSAIKDELDLRRTRFKGAENNPLKFSANVDDALHNLLVKRNSAYLGPVAAFESAFVDLRHHQVAMLAGIQAAFESLLGYFDPDRLQEDFDRQLGAGLVPAKLRYWDLYRARVLALAKDMDTSYRELFAREFARAYAERLERLKAAEGRSEGPAQGPGPSDS